jgi:hypothetical protein
MERAPLETRRHYLRRVAERQRFLADVLVTAVEGGINSWATVIEYHPEPASEARAVVVDTETYAERMEETYKPDGTPPDAAWFSEHGHEVGVEDLDIAIERVRSYEAQIGLGLKASIDYGSSRGDAGEIDADAADALFQIAAFGEITYG